MNSHLGTLHPPPYINAVHVQCTYYRVHIDSFCSPSLVPPQITDDASPQQTGSWNSPEESLALSSPDPTKQANSSLKFPDAHRSSPESPRPPSLKRPELLVSISAVETSPVIAACESTRSTAVPTRQQLFPSTVSYVHSGSTAENSPSMRHAPSIPARLPMPEMPIPAHLGEPPPRPPASRKTAVTTDAAETPLLSADSIYGSSTIMEGELIQYTDKTKWSNMFAKDQRRWFVVDEVQRVLCYYSGKPYDRAEPKGVVIMQHCQQVLSHQMWPGTSKENPPHTFVIQLMHHGPLGKGHTFFSELLPSSRWCGG